MGKTKKRIVGAIAYWLILCIMGVGNYGIIIFICVQIFGGEITIVVTWHTFTDLMKELF